MRYVEQHRTQTILALFHVGTILVGSIAIGLILKAFGYTDGQEMSWIVVFVRNWGFVLTLIPVFWVLSTIWMELHHSWHSRRVTLVSGVLLWAALIWFFILMAARASSILFRMGNQ
jgi:hypothetical protein